MACISYREWVLYYKNNFSLKSLIYICVCVCVCVCQIYCISFLAIFHGCIKFPLITLTNVKHGLCSCTTQKHILWYFKTKNMLVLYLFLNKFWHNASKCIYLLYIKYYQSVATVYLSINKSNASFRRYGKKKYLIYIYS